MPICQCANPDKFGTSCANEEIKAKAKVKKVKGQKSSYPSFLSIINSLSIPKAFGTNLQSLRTRNGKHGTLKPETLIAFIIFV